MKEADELNAQQRIFCHEYLVALNQRKAYRAAYPDCTTDESADASASALLRVPKVAAYVKRLQDQRANVSAITAERIVEELAKIAFGDIRNVVSWGEAAVVKSLEWDDELEDFKEVIREVKGGVDLRDSNDISDDAAATITEISEDPTEFGSKRKVKLADKTKALELLARYRGVFALDNRQKKLFTITDPNDPDSAADDGILKIEIVRPGERPGTTVTPVAAVSPGGPVRKPRKAVKKK